MMIHLVCKNKDFKDFCEKGRRRFSKFEVIKYSMKMFVVFCVKLFPFMLTGHQSSQPMTGSLRMILVPNNIKIFQS